MARPCPKCCKDAHLHFIKLADPIVSSPALFSFRMHIRCRECGIIGPPDTIRNYDLNEILLRDLEDIRKTDALKKWNDSVFCTDYIMRINRG